MTDSDKALLDLVGVILAGDAGGVSARLATSPGLAREHFREGGTGMRFCALVCGRRWTGALGRAIHQKGKRHEDRGDSNHDPDDVHVGQQTRLDLCHAIDLRARVVNGVGDRGASLHPGAGQAGTHGFEGWISRRGIG